MNELPFSSLLQNGIFPYEQTKKRIRCKIRQPVSMETKQYLEYWERIQPIPIECELVDADTFQTLVDQSRQKSFLKQLFIEKQFSQVLETAHQQDCSDVHFEPYSDVIQIFIRQQGKRTLLTQWPIEWQQSFVQFIKIKAELDIHPTTKPLNGQFSYILSKATIVCRLSILPCLHGDCIVIRLHDNETNQQRSMEIMLQTRFAQSVLAGKPGLWIIAGPIGNGKTTTYYHLLNECQSKHRLISFEDPVEIKQPRLWQQKADARFLCNETVEALLRQGISLIGFGEVRALIQLKFVVSIASTGHCTLITFHASSLEGVVYRLKNFGYTSEQQWVFLRGILFQHFERKDDGTREVVFQDRLFLPDLFSSF